MNDITSKVVNIQTNKAGEATRKKEVGDAVEVSPIKDLDILLQQSLGNDVTVKDQVVTLLPLSKGDNYGSTMVAITATVKKDKESPEEKMQFVGKLIPALKFQRENMKIKEAFSKEAYVYKELREQYRQLEREAEIKEDDLIDIFPKFYGFRLTRNPEIAEVIDDDVILLMENLRTREYNAMDRVKGVDFEHMKISTLELAHFHALGTVLKSRKPALFEEAKKRMNALSFKLPDEEIDEVVDHILEILSEDSRIKRYAHRVRQAVKENHGFAGDTMHEEIEPWISILHGDSTINNVLFHHAPDGKIDDIKVVDYQLSRICSPLRDLPHHLCTSSNIDVLDKHFDTLLDIYHAKYIDVLARMGCDATPYSKKSFEKQLSRDAKIALFRCLLKIKFLSMEVSEDTDLNDVKTVVMMSGGNESYFERSWRTISIYAEKNWI